MNKPTLYGISSSRAFRSIWAAEEIGLDYDHVPTSFRGDNQKPEFLAVNPNGRIPALVDGELQLFESMAINLYLTKNYGARLLPEGAAGEAKVLQWSVWGISEIEPLQMQIVVKQFFTPEDKRDAEVVSRATQALARPLGVLNTALGEGQYLLGEEFTIADLNVAGVMDLLMMLQFDFSQWEHVARWLKACQERPSYSSAKAVGS